MQGTRGCLDLATIEFSEVYFFVVEKNRGKGSLCRTACWALTGRGGAFGDWDCMARTVWERIPKGFQLIPGKLRLHGASRVKSMVTTDWQSTWNLDYGCQKSGIGVNCQ